MGKTSMGIDYAEIEKIYDRFGQFGDIGENAINDYLHTVGGEKIVHGITPLIPISTKGTNHARNAVWWTQDNYNLSVTISNSLKGKAGGKHGKSVSRYYLYFVDTATGTSAKKGRAYGFMAEGMQNVHKAIADEMLEHVVQTLSFGR